MKLKYKSATILLLIIGIISQSCKDQHLQQNSNDNHEKYRPYFHFTPESMWMNDPNGMVYYEGEYHLFYQYYPDSTVWGPMHWGHAVSKNLVQWEHLPIALHPDSLGYIFSGSAVVDWNNTTGFGTKDNPPLIAIYTYHNMVGEQNGDNDFQSQAIAYSLDKGRTWTKYENNPVLKNPGIRDFRDPKVRWYGLQNKWIMTLAVKDHISFYSSPDLKTWKHESDFQSNIAAYGGVWECPDLFPLTSETGENKWILLVSINPGAPNGGSGTQYFVGDFDGHQFINENKKLLWVDYGKDNYAGVTWSDVPEEDGRVLFIGWMSNWQYAQKVPTRSWRSAMTFPRKLTLQKQDENYMLLSNPVREIQNIYSKKDSTSNITPGETMDIYNGPQEITFTLKPDNGIMDDFSLLFSNEMHEELIINYVKDKGQITINRDKSGEVLFSANFTGSHTAPFANEYSQINFKILLDVSSIELFVNNGEVVMTDIFFPTSTFNKVKLEGSANTRIDQFMVIELEDKN